MKHRVIFAGLLFFSILLMIIVNGCLGIPDNIPPAIGIVNPAPGAIVTGTVNVIAVASDDREVEEIKIFIDGIEEFSTGSNFATFNWNTSAYADNQNHYIAAFAKDKDDNFGVAPVIAVRVPRTVAGDTIPPTLTIQNPAPNQVVQGKVNIVIQANDNTGVDSVQFFIDGFHKFTDTSEPYRFQWDVTDSINGSFHTIFARAFDFGGFNAVSPVIGVTVASGVIADVTPPSVLILYPPAGTTLPASSLGSIDIVVDVIDNVAADRVDFFIDGVFQATDNTAPFQYQWDLAPYGNGLTHTIYIKAYDTSNNLSTSFIPVTVVP